MKTVIAALALLTLGTTATAANAENPFAKDSTVLQLRGLDLTTAAGQQRLAIRMDQAARQVCGERLATVHIALGEQAESCRTAVIADIRNQIELRTAAADQAKMQLASR